jgi:hypothetical protein
MMENSSFTFNFDKFKKHYLGNEFSWRNGIDTDLIHRLNEFEKIEAEKLFLAELRCFYSFDKRPIVGLGELRSIKASDALKKAFKSWKALIDSNYKMCVAVALWKIERYSKTIPFLVKMLDKNDEFAATKLEEFNDPGTESSLLRAIYSKKRWVRHNAAKALLFRYGYWDIKYWNEHYWFPPVVEEILSNIVSKNNDVKKQAIAKLRSLTVDKKIAENAVR